MTASIWEASQIVGSTANADNSYLREYFTAVDGTNVFTLTTYVYQPATGSIDVFVNGVDQRITIDFTETSNDSVTVFGLQAGDLVCIKGLVGSTGAQSATDAAAAAAASAAAALVSENNAAASAVDSANSASDSATSAAAALVSETNADASEAAALVSAGNAAASANQAALNAQTVGAGAFAMQYVFSTATADSDPGAGKLRLNNATQNISTVIRADILDNFGASWDLALNTVDDSSSVIKGHIKLVKYNDQSKYILFTVSAVATPAGYKNITVAVVDSSSANPFADLDVLYFVFNRTGDQGIQGPPGGLTTVTNITSSTSITAANLSYQTVAMTAAYQSITLPDATTLASVNAPRAFFQNDGGYTFAIRNFNGEFLMAVAPGGRCYVNCSSIASAVGVWNFEGTDLEPGFVLSDSTLSTTFVTSSILTPNVVLDANVSIEFLAIASGYAAIVIDTVSKTVSTPVTISATATAIASAAFKITATTFIVFSETTNSAVVVSLTGSTGSYSLSVGTPQSYAVPVSTSREDSVTAPRIAQLTTTLYLKIYQDNGTNQQSAQAFSISGTTITVGSALAIVAGAAANAPSVQIYTLTSTTALAIFQTAAAAPFALRSCVLSVSGTTVTNGTIITFTGMESSVGTQVGSVLMSTTKAIVLADANSTTLRAGTLSVSGTTVTVGGTGTQIDPSATAGQHAYNAEANRYALKIAATSATTAIVQWTGSGATPSRSMVISEAAGVITANTIYYGLTRANSSGTGYGIVFPYNSLPAEVVSIRQNGTNPPKLALICNQISGTTISAGVTELVPELSYVTIALGSNLCGRTANGDYVLGIQGDSSYAYGLPVFRSNGIHISRRGKIRVTDIKMNSVAITRADSQRLVLKGVTNVGNTTSAGENIRILNVEIAK